MGGSIYVVPDIHGCLHALHEAERRIAADRDDTEGTAIIVYLGDYVDRGPDSAGVIEHLIEGSIEKAHRIMLCGNHDQIFHAVLSTQADPRGWLSLGGRETLRSYGMYDADINRLCASPRKLAEAVRSHVPDSHKLFLKLLPVAASIGPRHIFVHAGLYPGRPLDLQTDKHLMWIREPFLTDGPQMPVVVVHGHTIVREPEFREDRIALDTGAFRSGRLTVLKIANGVTSLI
ncbi:metallophosphoesterase family protein [Ferranicluibacter rubi]|uniref:Serine/threonine protein phosphatase n=1 Tax=Ferranicluibacter rubi TaxID=2715133 RepID=A0AA43ZDI7_9HYPH|nr:metallophosphoesterase family protein [Ferranicluibacter rubi]NHT74902.1 serine/threonine protein phosphatase [Ferranicluibacter rubi]TCQ12400.1 serine/threonine protein phosphatase 1 [Rhizobium sp. PP-F2F-G36]TCQ28837.1 serine/threonine protein phosphatase 1 [Rhizobium sp. PP-CC-3G-465]